MSGAAGPLPLAAVEASGVVDGRSPSRAAPPVAASFGGVARALALKIVGGPPASSCLAASSSPSARATLIAALVLRAASALSLASRRSVFALAASRSSAALLKIPTMTVAVSLRLEFSASSADLALSTSAFSSASLLLSATARSASFLASASAFSASRTLASDSSLSLAIAASLSATARSLARISASLAASTPATCVRTAVGAVSRELGGGTHLCFGLDFRGLLHGLVHLDEGFRDGCGRLRPGGLAELAAVSTGHLRSRLRPLCGVRFGGNAGGGPSEIRSAARRRGASRRTWGRRAWWGRGRKCVRCGVPGVVCVARWEMWKRVFSDGSEQPGGEMELQQRRPRGEKIEKEEARCGSRMSSLRIPRGAD